MATWQHLFDWPSGGLERYPIYHEHGQAHYGMRLGYSGLFFRFKGRR